MRILFYHLCFFISCQVFAQAPIGVWQTIDDESGKPKSHVEIFEQNGKLFGKVVKILDPTKADKRCESCAGAKKNKPILGMEILWDLVNDGDVWEDGNILDPNNGKIYSCYLESITPDKLKVRGYLGFSLLGRSQYWIRVN